MITILKNQITKLSVVLFLICIIGFTLNDHFNLKRDWIEAIVTTTVCFLLGFLISIMIEILIARFYTKQEEIKMFIRDAHTVETEKASIGKEVEFLIDTEVHIKATLVKTEDTDAIYEVTDPKAVRLLLEKMKRTKTVGSVGYAVKDHTIN